MKLHQVPVKPMTPANARGLGRVVDDFDAEDVAIVAWPQAGWRPVIRGKEGGITQGAFETAWRGELLIGLSDSFEVDDFHSEYVLGWSRDPAVETRGSGTRRPLRWRKRTSSKTSRAGCTPSSNASSPRNRVYTYQSNCRWLPFLQRDAPAPSPAASGGAGGNRLLNLLHAVWDRMEFEMMTEPRGCVRGKLLEACRVLI